MVYALFQTIDLIFSIYIYVLVISVVFSWLYTFNIINVRNRFIVLVGNFLYRVTEPVLGRIRKILPDLGPIDISPIIVFILIYFIRTFMWYTYVNIYL
ncbi:YggT family protein [Bartonella sp. B10]